MRARSRRAAARASARKPAAERGGVSRPSVNACSRTRSAGSPASCASSAHGRDDVLVERVDPTGTDEAHEVQPRPSPPRACRAAAFSAALVAERAVRDRAADARQVLEHGKAGAEVEVPDLASCPSARPAGRPPRPTPRAGRTATSPGAVPVPASRAAMSALRRGSSPMPKPSSTHEDDRPGIATLTAWRARRPRHATMRREAGRPSARRRRPAPRRRRARRRRRPRCRP